MFQYFNAHLVMASAVICTIIAAGVCSMVLKFALDEGPQKNALSYLLLFCFGPTICAALWFGQHEIFSQRLYPVMFALGVCILGEAMLPCWVGWCCSIPDRDIVVRWRWQSKTDGCYNVDGWRNKLAVFCACPPLLPITVAGVVGNPKVGLGFPMLPFGMLAVGALVGAVTLTGSSLTLVKVTWRALVVFLTYDMQRAGSEYSYRFPRPFGDYRLRWLLLTFVVLLSTIAVFSWSGVKLTTASDPVTEFITSAAKLLGLSLLALVSVFVTLAGSIGPALALYYREFAEGAVKVAERRAS